jgi:PAS domain S-box-containing protein
MNWELTTEQRDRFFELTLDMLCISSGDGYFKWLNPAFSKTLGWSMSELLAHPYTYFVHPGDLTNTLDEVERQMKAGERVFHFENRYRHKDGSWRTLAWKSTPFSGLMYAVARDVTEQNRVKGILQASNAEVQELQRRVERAAKIGHWYWRGLDKATDWRDGISEYSDSGLALLGLKPGDKRFTNEEFIQRFVHPDDRRLVEQAFDSAADKGGYALEYRIVRPGGEVRVIYERAEHLSTDSGTGSLSSGILQDITDKRTAEEAIKASEDRYRQVVELSQELIWIHSAGVIVFANTFAAKLLGASSPADLVGRPFVSLIHPDDRELSLRRTASLLQKGGALPATELRLRALDGRDVTVEISGVQYNRLGKQYVLAIGRDVTQHRGTEAALREIEETSSQVLETAITAYIRMADDGRITGWNAQAEKTFGWARDEVIGKHLSEIIVPPSQRSAHLKGLQRYLTTGVSRLLQKRVDLQAIRRSGEEFPVEAVISAIHTKNGLVFSAFLRDMTETRRTEQQLQQVQKLDAVGQLTAGIAHDFNNLLGVVIGNLDAVLEDIDPQSKGGLAATRALNGALHGAELTRRLLAFARDQTLEPKAFAINDMLPDVVALLKRTLGASIAINLAPSPDLWPAYADPSQVQDAVLNLAINARDAMPEGGVLTIETANVTLDEDYARENLEVKPGDYAMLAVTDTGTGIAPEIMKRVLEPFFTTKPVGQGTGLGLSMIYGFAKQSNGYLKIYSEIGHGTTVKLYLPRARDLTIEAPQITRDHGTPPRGSEHVLVVEDNDGLRRTAVTMLEGLGYRVSKAENAEAALVLLNGSEHIDLLFSDVVMTGRLTGMDLAQRATTLRPQIKILLTTGYAEKASVEGAPDWPILNKPYRRKELAVKFREVLEYGD